MNKPYVISISAVAGGGKTSTAKALADKLENGIAFYFDDYEYINQPDNIGEWIDKGANPKEWNLSLIEDDINTAIQSGKYKYIVIDYPFGKNSGYKLSKLIDLAVLINTPLDIALSRRILRDFSDKSKDDILNELSYYPSIRKYFARHNNDVTQHDFIVDGCLSIPEIVEEIKTKI
jgi:uridine kinase